MSCVAPLTACPSSPRSRARASSPMLVPGGRGDSSPRSRDARESIQAFASTTSSNSRTANLALLLLATSAGGSLNSAGCSPVVSPSSSPGSCESSPLFTECPAKYGGRRGQGLDVGAPPPGCGPPPLSEQLDAPPHAGFACEHTGCGYAPHERCANPARQLAKHAAKAHGALQRAGAPSRARSPGAGSAGTPYGASLGALLESMARQRQQEA